MTPAEQRKARREARKAKKEQQAQPVYRSTTSDMLLGAGIGVSVGMVAIAILFSVFYIGS